jgi:glutamate/tyrosine decarboxylase-like PLP-dependent enzyme
METEQLLTEQIRGGLQALEAWQSQWPAFRQDETLRVRFEDFFITIADLMERLTDNYPFYHPAYAGQMLKPPHPIATVAYFLAQQINPNNHALDGGPATAALERESVAELAAMFGLDPATTLGHLTSSGTIANLEALWVARSIHPEKAIAFSEDAHYTHGRMCEVIGARGVKAPADAAGRMDVDALRALLVTEEIGTVVVTPGTTGLGAVDPIDRVLELQAEFGFRVHVDAAYGGFYAILASAPDAGLTAETRAAFGAIPRCDSVVVDPHKHGLQPYGCGSVLFRDASVGRFYQHDSPYTYFTSAELHLGEISLECSRAGAAAAALWATLRCFPLDAERGFGPVLRKNLAAARRWAGLLRESAEFRLVLEPDLDILAFYPLPADGDRRVSRISAETNRVFDAGLRDGSLYLAKLNLGQSRLAGHSDVEWDQPSVTVLRSVLMKPEHLSAVPRLHLRLLELLGSA